MGQHDRQLRNLPVADRLCRDDVMLRIAVGHVGGFPVVRRERCVAVKGEQLLIGVAQQRRHEREPPVGAGVLQLADMIARRRGRLVGCAVQQNEDRRAIRMKRRGRALPGAARGCADVRTGRVDDVTPQPAAGWFVAMDAAVIVAVPGTGIEPIPGAAHVLTVDGPERAMLEVVGLLRAQENAEPGLHINQAVVVDLAVGILQIGIAHFKRKAGHEITPIGLLSVYL